MPAREDSEAQNHRDMVTLKEFLLRLVADHEKHFNQEIASIRREQLVVVKSADTALTKAEMATHEKLAGMNEFRQTVTDREAAFARKTEMSSEINRLDEKIKNIDEKLSQIVAGQQASQGQQTGSAYTWGVILAAGSIAISLAAVAVAVFK